jgi:hypothetical protein
MFVTDFVNTRGALLGRTVLADGREFRANTIMRFVPVSDTGLVRAICCTIAISSLSSIRRAKSSTKTVTFDIRRVEQSAPMGFNAMARR